MAKLDIRSSPTLGMVVISFTGLIDASSRDLSCVHAQNFSYKTTLQNSSPFIVLKIQLLVKSSICV